MKVAVVFPGQGSQFAGMVDPWMDHPAGREALHDASDVLGWDVVERSRDPEALARTEVVQPAVFACDLAAYAVMQAEGIAVSVAAGHSLGEYAALVASGAVDLEPGLSALAARADAMGEASRTNPGAMTALLGLSPEEAHEVCAVAGRGDVLAVANENSQRQTVLSGSISAVEKAEELARTRGAKAVRLNVAGAFHSPLMEPALPAVRQAISKVDFREPSFLIVPNVTGRPTQRPMELRDLLSRHLVSPVKWDATLKAIGSLGVTHVIEAGPGDVLTKLAKRAVPDARAVAAGTPQKVREAADGLASGAE
jgi:[acyl-carrier-protein] S-malonyltransferase